MVPEEWESWQQFHTFYVTFNNEVQSHNVADAVISTLFTAHFKNIIFIVECVFTQYSLISNTQTQFIFGETLALQKPTINNN